jgi:hypothetical protein
MFQVENEGKFNGIECIAVARREVFVSVSAFKPKVKNVSPRAWTEPIAVLLLSCYNPAATNTVCEH